MSTKPYDCELEYLESTGTQYIDTGIQVGGDATISVTAKFVNGDHYYCVWSARKVVPGTPASVTNTFTLFRFPTNVKGRFDYGAAQTAYEFDFSDWETKHEYKAVANNLYIDNILISTATASTFTAGSGVYLFASESTTNQEIVNFAQGRLYSAKIIDGGSNILLDLIPVLKDGVGYMYDKVSGTLFGNAGTGSFVLGPRVGPMFEPPSYVRRLEYLESTGTQYVDTGVVATSRCRIECDWTPTSLTGSSALMGVVATSGAMESDRFQVLLGPAKIGFGIGDGFLSAGADSAPTWSIGAQNTSIVDALNLTASNNGTPYAPSSGSYSADISAKSIYVFSINGKISTRANASVRVSRAAIYDGATLVRDFVPVMEDGVGYLFDRVSGRMFGNSGTGSFVLGPMVGDPYLLPSYARRVEYLESTGTQWIDTGVVPSSSFGFEIMFAETVRQTNTNAGIFGREITDGNTTRCTLFTDWTHHPVFYGDDKITFDSVLPVNQTTSFGASASTGECHVGNTSLNGFTLNGSYTDTVRIFPNQAKPAIGRVYSCQIFSGSTPVRSFVPCRILDTGYLWDEVEGKFYGNQGTGDFVLGPDVREGVVPTRLNPFGVGRRQEGIRRVEYLESTGTQWIDTGVAGGMGLEIEARAQYKYRGTCIVRVGFKVDNTQYNIFLLTGTASTNVQGAYNPSGLTNLGVDIPFGSWFDAKLSNRTMTVNGQTVYADPYTVPESTGGYNLGIFGYKNPNTEAIVTSAGVVSYVKIWKNGTLVRDFVPVAIGSTGYLLDRVSGRLFGNQGTGDFVLGPDIVPVEYVESTGSQYVDTGIAPTPTLSLDCAGYFPNTVPGTRFGSRVSTTSECFYVSGVTYGNVDRVRFSFGSSGTGAELQRYADPKPLRRFILDAALKSASLEYADGTSGVLSFSQSAFTGSYPIFLFAANMAGTASYSIAGTRLSACRIIDGSTLVRDFIPVRVGSVGALYDRVTDTVFRSATPTPLVAGPDARHPAG